LRSAPMQTAASTAGTILRSSISKTLRYKNLTAPFICSEIDHPHQKSAPKAGACKTVPVPAECPAGTVLVYMIAM